MKKIKPEDLSLNIRNVTDSKNAYLNNENARAIVETKDGCNTREDCFTLNKCYTQDDCDTLDDCVTNIYCDTDGACKTATCKCGTAKCPTAMCGATQSEAVLCCPLTKEQACVIDTKNCQHTNPCLVSKDIECNISIDIECHISIEVCSISEECEETYWCPATGIGEVCHKNR